MARYDYKTLARDPAKQQEVLRFCDAFEQFMADNSFPADEREKYQEVFGDLRETAQGNTVGHNVLLDQKETIAPLLNDFDNMVDFVRGRMVHLDSANHDLFERMKQSVPGAEQFLQGIEMPERGTAGYNFDQSRDFLMFSGTYSAPHERSMDGQTAQMHIATAFDVPTLAIFGPTTRELGFFPYGEGHRVIEVKDLPCRPCALHGGRKCPLGHFKCMNDISVDEVFNNAKEMLEQKK